MKDTGAHICQVAIVALDARRLRQWYQDTFGFLGAGKTLFFPPISTRVQGVPAFEKISWLIDGKDYFNLEFFQFLKPSSKARGNTRSVVDIGYNIMGIHVVEFDKVLERSIALGGQRVSQNFGTVGQRRACIKDPEGNVIELFERDPLDGDSKALIRPKIPATVRSMTTSVPDLQQARKTYVDALGLVARVAGDLTAGGWQVSTYAQVQTNPTVRDVEGALARARGPAAPAHRLEPEDRRAHREFRVLAEIRIRLHPRLLHSQWRSPEGLPVGAIAL